MAAGAGIKVQPLDGVISYANGIEPDPMHGAADEHDPLSIRGPLRLHVPVLGVSRKAPDMRAVGSHEEDLLVSGGKDPREGDRASVRRPGRFDVLNGVVREAPYRATVR